MLRLILLAITIPCMFIMTRTMYDRHYSFNTPLISAIILMFVFVLLIFYS
jgi:hypothetical protein